MVVSDGELYLDIYQKRKLGKNLKFPYGMPTNTITSEGKTPLMEVSRVFSEGGGHLSAYDFMTLETMLNRVGFIDIKKENFRCGRYRMLFIDSELKLCESLYVEAYSHL